MISRSWAQYRGPLLDDAIMPVDMPGEFPPHVIPYMAWIAFHTAEYGSIQLSLQLKPEATAPVNRHATYDMST